MKGYEKEEEYEKERQEVLKRFEKAVVIYDFSLIGPTMRLLRESKWAGKREK